MLRMPLADHRLATATTASHRFHVGFHLTLSDGDIVEGMSYRYEISKGISGQAKQRLVECELNRLLFSLGYSLTRCLLVVLSDPVCGNMIFEFNIAHLGLVWRELEEQQQLEIFAAVTSFVPFSRFYPNGHCSVRGGEVLVLKMGCPSSSRSSVRWTMTLISWNAKDPSSSSCFICWSVAVVSCLANV